LFDSFHHGIFFTAGIKAIKLYAWEEAYVDRIGELRELELKQIRKTQMLTALNTALFMVRVRTGL
jgi:hypothetical protein